MFSTELPENFITVKHKFFGTIPRMLWLASESRKHSVLADVVSSTVLVSIRCTMCSVQKNEKKAHDSLVLVRKKKDGMKMNTSKGQNVVGQRKAD